MIGRVRGGGCMTRGPGGGDGCLISDGTSRCMGRDRGLLRIPNRDLTSRPCFCNGNRAAWAFVQTGRLEERQYSRGTFCSPISQEPMAGPIERAASMCGDETAISHRLIVYRSKP